MIWKVWTISFPTPCRTYRCDLWIRFYGKMKFGDFDPNLVGGTPKKNVTFASHKIESGSPKLLEIWPWFFFHLIDLVGGGVESANHFFIRRLHFSLALHKVRVFENVEGGGNIAKLRLQNVLLREYQIKKNCHLRAFGFLKLNLSIVWTYGLLSRKDMSLGKALDT